MALFLGGVWFRVTLALTASNKHDPPPPLSQYIQCMMEVGLEESDIIADFGMGSSPNQNHTPDIKLVKAMSVLII